MPLSLVLCWEGSAAYDYWIIDEVACLFLTSEQVPFSWVWDDIVCH